MTIARSIVARLFSSRVDARLLIAGVSLFGMIVYFGSYFWHATPPRDQYGYVLGRDFVNMWMGAKAVLSGTVPDLFNTQLFMQRLVEALGPQPPHNWSYPPVLLLFIWPLGYMPYMTAFTVWSVSGFGAYLGSAALFRPAGTFFDLFRHGRPPRRPSRITTVSKKNLDGRGKPGHDDNESRTTQVGIRQTLPYLLFAATAPAVAANLFSGQNGFFTAAVLIVFCRFLDERPLLAGAVLGLMLCKPHLAALFPLALALSGRWRAFLAAGVSAAGLAVTTALVFDPSIWTAYFRLVVPVQHAVMTLGTGFLTMMPTGFMHARMLDAPLSVAWTVQAPFTLFAVAAVLWTFVKRRDLLLSLGVLVTASIIASPYSFNYDMVALGWLTAMLWPRLTGLFDRVLLLTVWTLPLTVVGLGEQGLPLGAPLLALFLVRLLYLLHQPKPAFQPV